jgi:hypothetical protein
MLFMYLPGYLRQVKQGWLYRILSIRSSSRHTVRAGGEEQYQNNELICILLLHLLFAYRLLCSRRVAGADVFYGRGQGMSVSWSGW